MVKNLLHRIIAISLALLMLLSSTGISMDIHYCQDHIKGISFLGKAKTCHDKQTTSSCQKSKKTCNHDSDNLDNIDKDDCCHNEGIVIKKSDVDATSIELIVHQDLQLEFIASIVSTFVFDCTVSVDFQPYELYKPPLPDRDILVLYQTFLI